MKTRLRCHVTFGGQARFCPIPRSQIKQLSSPFPRLITNSNSQVMMKKLLASAKNVKCKLISKGNNTENEWALLRILTCASVLKQFFFFRATTASASSNARTLRHSLSREWKHTGKEGVQLHSFLPSALDRGQWSNTIDNQLDATITVY